MPSKRTKRARASGVPEFTRAMLEIGCGINRVDQEWAQSEWNQYGPQLIAEAERSGRQRPFAEIVFGAPA